MKIKNYSLPFLFILFFMSSISIGQKLIPQAEASGKTKTVINPDFCSTDFFHNQKMKTDEAYRKRYLKTIEDIKKISSQTYKKAAGGVAQIPVVIHVMHKGEAIGTGTNITDEDVKKGIQYLNNYWRKVSGTTGFGDGVDMKIEFTLAIRDQNGNCTTGIDRVDMSGVPAYVSDGVNRSGTNGISDYNSSGGINSLKEYSIWDPTKYYNVWIVDEIDNANCFSGGSYTAGYAYYASAHGLPYDGSVVLICSYLNQSDTTWAHEMGHAFNLPHTFDGDDPNNDGVGDTCGEDGIADTPKHIRTSSISPSIYFNCTSSVANACDPLFNKVINPDTGFARNTGTVQDHMHNYMDYTGCPTEFTGGQRAVVSAALSAARASFLTSPALTPASPATVNFTSTGTNVCSGGSLTFYDASTCTPNTYTNSSYTNISFLWTFNNNVNPAITSTLQNPMITFNNLGSYDVTLAVTNLQGTTSLQKLGNIAVTSGAVAACSITSSNKNGNYGSGVTKVTFNTLSNTTTTFIPDPPINNFTCSKNTAIFAGTAYNLNVSYKSVASRTQYVEVWIDWDNSGTFQITNSNGVNERVLSQNIPVSSSGNPAVSITAPASATLNTLLRMRVISNSSAVPVVCGNGTVQRADDYAVYVKPACTPPTARITNNSSTTVLTCAAPSISLRATGGASYSWNNNKGITPTISVTEPGTYVVTVTSPNGCTATQRIVITESKPAPDAIITNITGATAITCTISSISVAASGGVSYSWDNGLGTNANATISAPGTYTVTVTAANGCTATKSIIITDGKAAPACSISSTNKNSNYGCGVTNVTLNTINKTTTTAIPATAMQDFVCTNNTILATSTAYTLSVTFKARSGFTQYLEVWIDWDNNGLFQSSNSNGVNERVLIDNVAATLTKTATISITLPATATLNTLLRMRVISDASSAPKVCGTGFIQRADDYGVIVANPTTTIWSGSAWSAGVPTAPIEGVVNGVYATTANGAFTANKLTVTSLGSLTINPGTNVTVQNEVINNGSLVVENNANLIQVNNTVNSGTITVKRNSNALKRLDYTLWSSPVASQNLLAFSPLTFINPSRFYIYNSASNLYTNTVPITLDPATTNFSLGTGYLIRTPDEDPANSGTTSPYYLGSSALTYNGVFRGTPNNGDVPVTLSTAGSGYNLVGNPYPSSINLFTLRSNNSTVIGNIFYMWRKTNGIGTAYCSYVPSTATTGTYVTNGNAQSSATFFGNIQTAQGFFVSALTTGPLVFKNGQRVTTATSFFKTKQDVGEDKIWLNATNLMSHFSQMAITYSANATIGLDAFDGKYINDSPFALTSNVNNEEYIIQSRPKFDFSDVVLLNFKTDLAGDYNIAIDHAEGSLASTPDIYLLDSKTGIGTNLKTSSYSFTATAGIDNTRFSLKYQKTLGVEAPIFNEDSVTIYKNNGILYVNAGKMYINNIEVFDVQGKLISEQKNVKSTTATINNLKAEDQVIIVKVYSIDNQIVIKKVVN